MSNDHTTTEHAHSGAVDKHVSAKDSHRHSPGDDTYGWEGGFFSLFKVPPASFEEDVLRQLGDAMADSFGTDSANIPSGYVYLGQFLAHDVSKLPIPIMHPTPPERLHQRRTSIMELDSVYGHGFHDRRIAVDPISGEMRLGPVIDANGRHGPMHDLPRRVDKSAIIVDERNDENLLIAQLQVRFLKLHNFFVDKLPFDWGGEARFRDAMAMTISCYQHIIVHDLLHMVLDAKVWNYYFGAGSENNTFIWNPMPGDKARTPIEFAGAACRFGHSMVLQGYSVSKRAAPSLAEVFTMCGAGGFGNRPVLPDSHIVEWKRFFFDPHRPSNGGSRNLALAVDPYVHVRLPDGSALATKNLLTGAKLLLADGQSIVRHIQTRYPTISSRIDLKLLAPDEIIYEDDEYVPPTLSPLGMLPNSESLASKTPLWYYILADSFRTHRGGRLGPLGSLIIAESVRALVKLSGQSKTVESTAMNLMRSTTKSKSVRMVELLKVTD